MGLQFEEWRCCHERGIPKALEGSQFGRWFRRHGGAILNFLSDPLTSLCSGLFPVCCVCQNAVLPVGHTKRFFLLLYLCSHLSFAQQFCVFFSRRRSGIRRRLAYVEYPDVHVEGPSHRVYCLELCAED